MTAYSEQYAQGRRRTSVSLSKAETEVLITALAIGKMELAVSEIVPEAGMRALERAISKIVAADKRLTDAV
jgi:hypothetical protein